MTERRAYQLGLLDALNGKQTLVFVLAAASEKKLLKAYIRGAVQGRKLMAEPLLEWND